MHKVQFVSKESHLTKTENVKSQGERSWVKLSPVWKFRKLYLDASNDKITDEQSFLWKPVSATE